MNFTLEPELNPAPVIVTLVPYGPLVGLRLVTDSVGVKLLALVAVPAAVVTEIVPAVAPFGTVAVICVPPEFTVYDGDASPWNFTLLAPLKYDPEIITELPVIPLVGEKPEIVGAMSGVTV